MICRNGFRKSQILSFTTEMLYTINSLLIQEGIPSIRKKPQLNISNMYLSNYIHRPPRYVRASMLCSFGGFLWGYESLSNHTRYVQYLTREFQNGYRYHWLCNRHGELCIRLWFTVSHRSWTDCLRNLDPRRFILHFCRTSSRHTWAAEEYRHWRSHIWYWSGSRSGSSHDCYVRCRQSY